MRVRHIVLLLILLSSCVLLEKPKGISAEERFERGRRKVVHGALKKFIKSMEKKGYRAAGIGEGLDHSKGTEKEKQNYLQVTFDIESLPSIEFARKVEVEALQEFLHYINSEEGIEDYVAEYPFPINFLQVVFISKIRDKNLCSVSNFEEKISYYKDEPGKPLQGPLITVHSESYEDAVRVLEQQQ